MLIRIYRTGWFAAVSDGIGSCIHADFGSRAACWAAWQTARQLPFICENYAWIKLLQNLWLERLAGTRTAPQDASATCLMAWGQTDGRFRLAQLGDGLILGYPSPDAGLVSRDAAGFSNQTLGLRQYLTVDDWHFSYGDLNAPGDGLLLMTDGISDDLSTTQGLVQSVVKDLLGRGARSGQKSLTRELINWPTLHHTDDKTIVVIYRI